MSRADVEALDVWGEFVPAVEPPSIRALIEALDVGETYARAQRFDANLVEKHIPVEASRAMRLRLQATVHRIGKRTGRVYIIEGVDGFTQSRDIIVTINVTRKE